jgi:hypothetical protein
VVSLDGAADAAGELDAYRGGVAADGRGARCDG